MFAPQTRRANAYAQIHAETGVFGADPHQLVVLLLDGALDAIAMAFAALERGDLATKGRAIGRAVGIVDEGLRHALDMQAGGSVAATLYALYSCVLVRLTAANCNNDGAALRECSRLLAPLRDAWQAIKPQPRRLAS